MPSLRELRDAAGMSQVELAERVGVDPNTVYRWEAGSPDPAKRNDFRPRGPARKLLGMIFGVDPESITFGSGPSESTEDA